MAARHCAQWAALHIGVAAVRGGARCASALVRRRAFSAGVSGRMEGSVDVVSGLWAWGWWRRLGGGWRTWRTWWRGGMDGVGYQWIKHGAPLRDCASASILLDDARR